MQRIPVTRITALSSLGDVSDMDGVDRSSTLRRIPGQPMIAREDWQDIHEREPDDPSLDEEFPLGDGVADLSSEVSCPYCGESVEITLDPGSGTHQQYVEDCYVCCRPWLVSVSYHEDGTADVHVDANDDG